MSVVSSNEVNVQIGIQLGNDKPVYKVSGRCVAASICYLAFILCTMTVIFFIVMENTHSQWRFLGDYIRVAKESTDTTELDQKSIVLITRYNFVTYSQGVVYVACYSLLLACLFKTAESCCIKHIPEEFFTYLIHLDIFFI